MPFSALATGLAREFAEFLLTGVCGFPLTKREACDYSPQPRELWRVEKLRQRTGDVVKTNNMKKVGLCVLIAAGAILSARWFVIPHRMASAESGSSLRSILDPATVPSWFEMGKYRSARWDGGPIEAEKGVLSGWQNYTPDDPRQVLEATRDWYNPKTIGFLKTAHINWAWVTWSNGFSPETEKKQWALVRDYIALCHKSGIRVTAYMSIGNMFWKDMFEHLPASIAWVDRLPDGSPRFYSRPNRYMADITNPQWLELERKRAEAAVRAGADALWIDNTFSYPGEQNVAHFIDTLYAAVVGINHHIVIMSNYNEGLYTWGRLQNGVTTEDGAEPGYYTDEHPPYLVTNAGLLRYNWTVGEGWRPVSMEDGGRHQGDRMITPMQPRKWQLAIAECAMYHASFEPYFEGLFLHDLYFGEAEALRGLRAIGEYNAFLESNEEYYVAPQHSLAQVAILGDTTDAVVPYLNQLSAEHLQYDVMFNCQSPRQDVLRHYRIVLLPNTNPLSREWCEAIAKWVKEDGGTLIAVQDASLFQDGQADTSQDFGLGRLLGISKQNAPHEAKTVSDGKGRAVYLPRLLPAAEMTLMIKRYLGAGELVTVEPRTAILSSAYAQPKARRLIVHLLNYRQNWEQGISIEVRAPVQRAVILSPDPLQQTEPGIRQKGGSSEIVVPELYTYGIVAIYLGGKVD
jgi:hypothetical protein